LKKLIVIDPKERLGAGSKDYNTYWDLKSHPFFKGIDFDNIYSHSPPGANDFIIKPKDVNYKSKGHQVSERRPTVLVLKQDIVEKKSPWFHYNTRKLVLDSTPKIEYIDPFKNIVKVRR
jgi:hypothetical protein